MKNLKEKKIGTFKIKDKNGRNAIELDLGKIFDSFPKAKFLYIVKVLRENNKINIFVKYEDVPKIQSKKN